VADSKGLFKKAIRLLDAEIFSFYDNDAEMDAKLKVLDEQEQDDQPATSPPAKSNAATTSPPTTIAVKSTSPATSSTMSPAKTLLVKLSLLASLHTSIYVTESSS
jgi:hypothetical protein